MATTVSLTRWPALLEAQRQDGEDLVAVDDVALVVDREAAVGVTVEREPDVGAVLDDGRLERVEVGRAAAVVDVQAVGVGVDRDDVGAGVAERLRAGVAGGALGAVEHDLDAREGVVDGAHQVGGVLVDGRRGTARRGRRRRRSAASHVLAQPRSIAISIASSSLWPPRARNLMPLSGIGLWDAESITPRSAPSVAGQVGDTGRGQHAEQEHVDAGGGEAGHDGGLEELARRCGCPGRRRRAGGAPRTRHGRPGRVLRQRKGPGPAPRSADRWPGPGPRPCRRVASCDRRSAISACCTAAPCGPSSDRPSCAR